MISDVIGTKGGEDLSEHKNSRPFLCFFMFFLILKQLKECVFSIQEEEIWELQYSLLLYLFQCLIPNVHMVFTLHVQIVFCANICIYMCLLMWRFCVAKSTSHVEDSWVAHMWRAHELYYHEGAHVEGSIKNTPRICSFSHILFFLYFLCILALYPSFHGH